MEQQLSFMDDLEASLTLRLSSAVSQPSPSKKLRRLHLWVDEKQPDWFESWWQLIHQLEQDAHPAVKDQWINCIDPPSHWLAKLRQSGTIRSRIRVLNSQNQNSKTDLVRQVLLAGANQLTCWWCAEDSLDQSDLDKLQSLKPMRGNVLVTIEQI